MPSHQLNYPVIPDETLRAAFQMYGKGNLYLRLGDHLDGLLKGLEPLDLTACSIGDKAPETTIRYMLLTLLQFQEKLSNDKMMEAVRSRVDLKYALHLPLSGLHLDPDSLCTFRRQVFNQPASQQILQTLLERFTELGLAVQEEVQPVDAGELLTTVCTLNRLNEVVEAMFQVLESLATTDPEWLRQITLPYWYDRYNRRQRNTQTHLTEEKWLTRSIQVAADIKYLLGEIESSQNPKIASLREVQSLRQIWEEQFYIFFDGIDRSQAYKWSLTRCDSCRSASNQKEV